MSNKEIFDGFIEFINNQEASRPLNHDLWWTCAVGEYVREEALDIDEFNLSEFLYEEKGANFEADQLGPLGQALNTAGSFEPTEGRLNTYGELQGLVFKLGLA